jgi:hypothetical protein
MSVPEIRRVLTDLPLWQHEFDLGSGHVGFVADKITIRQVFFDYLVFLANSHSTKYPILIYHPWSVQQGN